MIHKWYYISIEVLDSGGHCVRITVNYWGKSVVFPGYSSLFIIEIDKFALTLILLVANLVKTK